MKRAFIVGSHGQDGRLLEQHLSSLGYAVLGIARDHIRALGLEWPSAVDVTDFGSVAAVVAGLRPDEIYYLAAEHSSSEKQEPERLPEIRRAYDVNGFGFLHFLEAASMHSPRSRLFYAASSHLFAPASTTERQDENTPFRPHNVYAMTKAAGVWLAQHYRRSHSLHVSSGILYNHESPLRPEDFLSRTVCRAVARIAKGNAERLRLARPDDYVDWSDAEDFVRAFHLILQLPEGDDYVIASSSAHSVQEFVEVAFGLAGLRWQDHLEFTQTERVTQRTARIGNPEKLVRDTGWTPVVSFEEMIRKMLAAEGLATKGGATRK